MENNLKTKLDEAITYGYEFRFSDYFSEGIDIFKKDIGSFVGYTAVYFGIMLVSGMIPFVSTIASVLLTYPLYVGFALVAHRIKTGQTYEFSNFFKGFDSIGPLALQYLVVVLIAIVLMVPIGVALFMSIDLGFKADPEDMLGLLETGTAIWMLLLLMIPLLVLTTLWRWAPYFVVFHGMGFWEGMEASRKLVSKNFLIVLAFMLAVSIFASLGIIALVIGIIFTLPIAMCVDYAAFADITGLNEADSGTDLLDHLVE